jgi:pimeloyl-ACP methyl ester carboxylesterase
MGVYPFMFGSIADFEPVVEAIVAKGLKEPYDWDEYASMFFPKAYALAARAEKAEAEGKLEEASELYLRSSAVYRIARFPTPRSPKQREAWEAGKKVFYKGAALMEFPIVEVKVPHTHKNAEDIGDTIFVNKCIPPGASAANPAPTVLIISGLDGYRTELAVWEKGWAQKGVATVIVEIPGTGDSPAAKGDPTSPDRQFSSLLDWMDSVPEIDSKRIVVWGFSTGGYYAIRVAHTHADRLMGVVSLGGGAHHMFDREWLENINKLEYPFDPAGSLTYKFGYGTDQQAFIKDAGKFSLLNDGTLAKPCARLLLVNGNDDEIFPIDDMYVVLENGGPKEARFVKGKKHMGEPDSFFIILTWIYGLFGIKEHWGPQMSTLPSKPKY